MINLNIERNEKGFYVLNDESLKGFERTHNVNQYSGEIDDSFWLTQGDTKILVKTSENPSYMMSLYSELLFAQFAEKNNIPCAEIDVGIYEGKPVLISKSVASKDSELISYTKLEELLGSEIKNNTVANIKDTICSNVDKLNESYEDKIKVSSNIYNNLLVIATLDFLVSQGDRHPGNILFEVSNVDGIKELNVASMFDNEASFGFMEVRAFYDEHPEYFDKIFSGENTDIEQFRTFFDKYVKENFLDVRPMLGVVAATDYDCHENLQDKMPEYGDGRYASFVNKIVCADIVMEMMKKPKFSSFCAGLEFDAATLAQEIEMETEGFKIPPQFVDLAQNMFNQKFKQLEEAMKKYSGKEMGE